MHTLFSLPDGVPMKFYYASAYLEGDCEWCNKETQVIINYGFSIETRREMTDEWIQYIICKECIIKYSITKPKPDELQFNIHNRLLRKVAQESSIHILPNLSDIVCGYV